LRSSTGDLQVRLKKPSKIGEKLYLEGHIEREEGRMLYARSEAKNERGEVLATAKAKCVKIRAPQAVTTAANSS
jgi:acyl-coenzyme A thioesterase PaaI-like protein